MNIVRGDVFFADLNPVVGAEQAGTRPVLIVQCNEANVRIPTVTVVPFTSNLRAGRFLFTLVCSAAETGLAKDSVALVFQLRTLDKVRLTRKLGHLSEALMEQVDTALALHLGL